MASTARSATRVDIVGKAFSEARRITFGIATFSSGHVDVATGLGTVHAFFTTEVSGAEAVATVVRTTNDFPLASGTVHVHGSICTEADETVAPAVSQQFAWMAIGV